MPRSGSTWLMELIWSQPGFKYVNEPLNLKGDWLREKSGIDGFEELYSYSSKVKVIKYFQGFTTGNQHFLDPNPLRKYYRPLTNRIVFKVIHGGELFINHLAKECNGRIIYLIRHPIAVALSRKQLPRMEQLCSDFVLDQFSADIKQYALDINRDGNELEQRILAWCIQNKLALLRRKSNWHLITYEQLTYNGEKIIDYLSESLQLPKKERMLKRLIVPSAVSVQSTAKDVDLMRGTGNDRLRLVAKWKKSLSITEIVSLMEICKKMNFNIYNEDGYPKKEFLIS